MSALTLLLTAMLCVLALVLLVDASRKPKLQDRIAGLVPGAALSATAAKQSRSRVRSFSRKAGSQIDGDLPDLIELVSVALSSGLSMHQGLSRVAARSSTKFAAEIQLLLKRVDLGSRFDIELSALCERMPTAAVREFANKISIAMARGTPLVLAFNSLSETLRARQANLLLAKAGTNETKMLIPLVTLVLPTTVIFAIYPSVQFLSLGLL